MTKLTIIIRQLWLVTATILINFTLTTAQTSSGKKIAVKEALDKVSELFGTKFVYERSTVRNKTTAVDVVSIKSQPVEEILKTILYPNNLLFLYVDKNHYTIVAKSSRGEMTKPEIASFVDNKIISPAAANEMRPLHIKGSVTDSLTNKPLAGVTVMLKGTSIGDVTDNRGRFSINAQNVDNPVLEFSMVGYLKKQLSVEDKSEVNIVLAAVASGLEEVVVVGYGTKSKRDLTGSITTINSKELQNFKSPTMDAMLQGQGTGIQVSQAGGTPGAPVRVMIRGTHSIYASAEPLWVIDGIPISNPPDGIGGTGRASAGQNYLATLNPNDIESIQVLKDAAATSIYGSRGSNGVILVTTKSGKAGQGYLSFDASAGVSDLTRSSSDIGFTNAEEWLALVDQGRSNYGLPSIRNDQDLNNLISLRTTGQSLSVSRLANTDWFNRILRKGNFNEYNLSLSRGYDKGSIFASLNYRKDQGVLQSNDFRRITGRINADYEPINNLKASVKINIGTSNNNQVMALGVPSGNDVLAGGGFEMAATGSLPIYPVWWDEASNQYFMPSSGYNVAASTDPNNFRFQLETYRTIGGISLDYKIPLIKGLSVRTEWSADINSNIRNFMVKKLLRPKNTSYGEYETGLQRNFNYNAYGTYNRSFNNVHAVNVVAGTESQRFSSRNIIVFGENFPEEARQFGTQDVARTPVGGFGGERYIKSYFSRASYQLHNRYIAGASFRRDGVSIFTPENRWSNFASGSLAWILSDESFMKNISWLNLGKLRLSAGQTGNQGVPQVTNPGYATWPVYGNTVSAANVSTIGVSGLTWETTNAYDVGFDFGLFNNHFSGSIGLYRQDIKGLLFQVPIPFSSGLPFGGHTVWSNIGDMRNQGLEFNINANIIDKSKFQWSASFNITTNSNKLIAINEAMDAKGQGIISGLTWNKKNAKIGAFYLAEFAGIDPDKGIPMIYEIERESYLKANQTIKTGKIIPATSANVNNNKILQKDKTGLPTFFGGFTNTISFKGFDLLAMFTFQGGNYIYDQAEANTINMGKGGNVLRKEIIGNTWTKPGDKAMFPQLAWDYSYQYDNAGGAVSSKIAYSQQTDQFLYKGDYARLRTLQLSYSLPSRLLSRSTIKNIRLFVSANNLLTITKFKGWDPEFANVSNQSAVRNLQQGVAGNYLPQLKTISVGGNITF